MVSPFHGFAGQAGKMNCVLAQAILPVGLGLKCIGPQQQVNDHCPKTRVFEWPTNMMRLLA